MRTIRDDTPLQYPLPIRIAKVQITGDWYACSGSNAFIVGYDSLQNPITNTGESAWLFDPIGIISGMLLALEDANGEFYLPSGSQVTVWQPPDALDGHWEPLAMGQPCSSASSSESSSGGTCNFSPVPNATAPTIDSPDQVWARKRDHVSGKWCYGWADTESCGSGS